VSVKAYLLSRGLWLLTGALLISAPWGWWAATRKPVIEVREKLVEIGFTEVEEASRQELEVVVPDVPEGATVAFVAEGRISFEGPPPVVTPPAAVEPPGGVVDVARTVAPPDPPCYRLLGTGDLAGDCKAEILRDPEGKPYVRMFWTAEARQWLATGSSARPVVTRRGPVKMELTLALAPEGEITPPPRKVWKIELEGGFWSADLDPMIRARLTTRRTMTQVTARTRTLELSVPGSTFTTPDLVVELPRDTYRCPTEPGGPVGATCPPLTIPGSTVEIPGASADETELELEATFTWQPFRNHGPFVGIARRPDDRQEYLAGWSIRWGPAWVR